MEGVKRSLEAKDVLIQEEDLVKILQKKENQDLNWNNYFEDVGEGRKYKGQWIRKQDFESKSSK